MLANARSASLTAFESGNDWATSASRTTALTTPRNRAAYGFGLPRLKSYSGRISSRSTAAPEATDLRARSFFMISAFTPRGFACTDQADAIAPALREHDGQQSTDVGYP